MVLHRGGCVILLAIKKSRMASWLGKGHTDTPFDVERNQRSIEIVFKSVVTVRAVVNISIRRKGDSWVILIATIKKAMGAVLLTELFSVWHQGEVFWQPNLLNDMNS
jgi:hypothetical protein